MLKRLTGMGSDSAPIGMGLDWLLRRIMQQSKCESRLWTTSETTEKRQLLKISTILEKKRDKADFSLVDADKSNVLDYLINDFLFTEHEEEGEDIFESALSVIEMIADSPFCTRNMVANAFENLIQWQAPKCFEKQYDDLMQGLFRRQTEFQICQPVSELNLGIIKVIKESSNPNFIFQIAIKMAPSSVGHWKTLEKAMICCIENDNFFPNAIISEKEGYTAAHLCAIYKWPTVLQQLFKLYPNPNIKDAIWGNSPLYYICQYFSLAEVKDFIMDTNIGWDFKQTNQVGQTAYSYYAELPNRNPALLKLLKDQTMNDEDNNLTADVEYFEPMREINERTLYPRPITPAKHLHIFVNPSTQNFADTVLKESENIYKLNKARKGKALVIAIEKFEVPSERLVPLPAYEEDVRNLTYLFDKIGFDVFSFTSMEGTPNHCLTAKEIEKSMDIFASMLSLNDQCAVVAILSHGGEGYIYGADGQKVYLEPLLRKLDNINCIQMAEKPKFILIQACQGENCDNGVTKRTGPDRINRNRVHSSPEKNITKGVVIPAISSFIIAYSAMKGYGSFTKGDQSVYVKHFIAKMAAFAGTQDLHKILTKVNRAVSEELIVYQNADNKQMPRFESCLTRDLYFLPHPNGKKGADWSIGKIPMLCDVLEADMEADTGDVGHMNVAEVTKGYNSSFKKPSLHSVKGNPFKSRTSRKLFSRRRGQAVKTLQSHLKYKYCGPALDNNNSIVIS